MTFPLSLSLSGWPRVLVHHELEMGFTTKPVPWVGISSKYVHGLVEGITLGLSDIRREIMLTPGLYLGIFAHLVKTLHWTRILNIRLKTLVIYNFESKENPKLICFHRVFVKIKCKIQDMEEFKKFCYKR